FDNRISWIEQPVRRLFFTFGVYLVYSFLVSFFAITCFVLIKVEAVTLQNISWMQMIERTVMPVSIAVLIISIFISRGWLLEWRNTAIEAEQLKSQKLESSSFCRWLTIHLWVRPDLLSISPYFPNSSLLISLRFPMKSIISIDSKSSLKTKLL